jgi:hypothetical protein
MSTEKERQLSTALNTLLDTICDLRKEERRLRKDLATEVCPFQIGDTLIAAKAIERDANQYESFCEGDVVTVVGYELNGKGKGQQCIDLHVVRQATYPYSDTVQCCTRKQLLRYFKKK